MILTNFSLPAHFNSRKDSPTSAVSVALYHLQSALLNQNRKGWGRATRILTAFDGASSDLLLSGLALSGAGYFWQKPPVVKSCGIVTVIVRVDRVVAPNRGIVVLIR